VNLLNYFKFSSYKWLLSHQKVKKVFVTSYSRSKENQPMCIISSWLSSKFFHLTLHLLFFPLAGTVQCVLPTTAGVATIGHIWFAFIWISDGAAALVLVSGQKAQELGLQVLARIRGYADAAQVSYIKKYLTWDESIFCLDIYIVT
jgi:hypothetical protein